MKKLSLVALILIGSVSIVSAQTSWWRTYGGTDIDWCNSGQQTADGGYIVAGCSGSIGAGWDVYLIKTNVYGDTLWSRTYGGTSADYGYSVQQTADGGYIIAGNTYSFGTGTPDCPNVYLIKANASGDALWTRTYGGSRWDGGYSVQQTLDGGYIICGWTYSLGSEIPDVYLVKTDADGDTLWTRAHGGTSSGIGNSVQQTSDSGYIIAGRTNFVSSYDVCLIKTNASGDALWTKTYGGSNNEDGCSVQQTSDGGYVIAGRTVSFGAEYDDVYLIKTDASGDTLWTRTYGGTSGESGQSVQQTADGGYIIAGATGSFGAGGDDVYLIKTDASGDTLWTRVYGGTGDDRGYSVRRTADGGYIIAGNTRSFGTGTWDVYLIKTDANGRVGVAEESPKPRVMRGRLGTTVLSGTSGVQRLASCVAFDAMGRRVLHPKPGVYFVKEAQAQAQAQAVRKVLLVR